MALTVVSNLTLISTCDSDDWDGGVGTIDTDFQKQGLGCLGVDTDIETERAYKTITQADWTGRHLYVWLMCMTAPTLDIKANGGMHLILVDSSGNEGYWHVAGSDTYKGGWRRFIISADTTPDANSGTNPSKTAITKVGVGFKCLLKSKLALNCFWDFVHYDTSVNRGYKITGAGDWDELLTQDETAAYGLIREESGVYYLQGTFHFGNIIAGNIVFADSNKILVFEDIAGSSDFHKIYVDAHADYITEFQLGVKSGTSGISGCIIKSAGSPKFQIDATNTNIDEFGLYGCTLINGGTMSLPTTATIKEALTCNFEACDQFVPNTASVAGCNFIATTDTDAALLWNENINIQDCNFIGNTAGAGIEMPSAAGSPYAYNALMFSGNTYDVYNSSGSAISINKNNGSNPTTYEGSSVTFLGISVDTKITCKDVVDLSVIEGARVLLEAADATGPLNFEESVTITRSGSTATVAHTAHGLSTNAWVHIKGANQPEYNTVDQITVTGADSYTYTVSGTPATPATGTITSTTAIFNTLTNASGIVSDQRTFASNQNVTGRARKSTSTPLYQSQPITGTIDKDNGLTLTVLMIPDE